MRIVNVMAASLDGHIASCEEESDEQRRSYGFTDEVDREFVRQQIRTCDAIVTGASSMRASGGAWSEFGRNGRAPHWYVFSRKGLDPGLRFWRQSGVPRTLVSPRQLTICERGVESLIYEENSPTDVVWQDMKNRGYEKVLLFGGGYINQLFYQAGLVDELLLTVCPLLVGSSRAPRLLTGDLSDKVFFKLNQVRCENNLVFLSYDVEPRLSRG